MTKQFPKSSSSHDNDRVATNHLKSIFPSHWKFISPRDIDSGQEYGEDWIIKVPVGENHLMTGVEFSVQNKVVTTQKGSRRISCQIAVKTLNHLVGLLRPVLFYFYDANIKTGYFLWLNEFLAENPESKWQGQEMVSISISRKDVLNSTAIEGIQNYVIYAHSLRSAQEKASRFNRQNTNYEIAVISDNTNITFMPRPKNKKAFEVDPYYIQLSVSPETREELQFAIEKGDSFQFRGKVEAEDGSLGAFFSSIRETREINVELNPVVPNALIMINIRGYDAKNDELLNTHFTQLRLIKSGSQIQRWQGMLVEIPITLILVFDVKNEILTVEIDFDTEKLPTEQAHDVLLIKRIFDFLIGFNIAHKIIIVNSREQEQVLNREPQTEFFSEEQKLIYQMIYGLAIIIEKTGIKIPKPDRFDTNDLALILETAELLQHGYGKQPVSLPENNVIPLTTPLQHIRTMIQRQEAELGNNILIPGEDMHVTIFGITIDLGPSQIDFANIKIRNMAKTKRQLEKLKDSQSEIEVHFDIDPDHIYIRFPSTAPQ